VESVLSQKATDAVALAMEASREFMVTSNMDLQRELRQLDMEPPLSDAEQVRLGDRLDVDQVASGEITRLRINQKTGEAEIGIAVSMLDVKTGEYLNGANETTTTKPIPGWHGEETRVVNDALREIATDAVAEILANRVTEGYVTSVNNFGNATINIGHDDKLQSGMEMLLLRPVWQKDLEEMIMVKIGRYSVSEVSARSSRIVPLGEGTGRARVGDRAYKLYRGPERVEAYERKASHKETLTTAAAILALLGVVAVATGQSSDDPPEGVRSHLFQQAPGDEAVIRVRVDQSSPPLEDQVFAWLFFRDSRSRFFATNAGNLIAFIDEATLPRGVFDDGPEFSGMEVDEEFNYVTQAGDEDQISLELVFYDFGLQPGTRYYHRVQRVVEPIGRAGAGAPIATGQVGTQQDLETPLISIEPGDALSPSSRPTAGITYFTPPVLQSPEDGSQNQSTSSITFTWNSTLGANEYILQVFPEDDPDGLRAPRYSAQVRQDTGGTMFHTINDTFAPNSRFYWRVGARRSGEPLPENGRLDQRGWLFSDIRTFTTASAPPPPPGTSAAGHSPDGGQVRGGTFGQGRYLRQVPGTRSQGIR
jgi:hypothetical protein